jgi:uncharacterized surface protein with fasciclin (FAS1) repeats
MNHSKTILEKLQEIPELSTFLKAVEKTDICELVRDKKLFTVFAPNNNAYAKIPQSTFAEMFKELTKLKDLTSYHFVPGRILFKDLSEPVVIQSIQGENLSLNPNEFYTVNNVKVIKPDIECQNGVIHIIYKVLDPYERV